jgi:hypothetical protein
VPTQIAFVEVETNLPSHAQGKNELHCDSAIAAKNGEIEQLFASLAVEPSPLNQRQCECKQLHHTREQCDSL